MQGAYLLYIEGGELGEGLLDHLPELPDDVHVVPSGTLHPIVGGVVGTEPSECVGREQDALGGLVGHYDLGPVDHHRLDEVQFMLPQVENVAFLDHVALGGHVLVHELGHHLYGLGGGYYPHIREHGQDGPDVGGVVGLHMVYHEVIEFPAVQDLLEIRDPFVRDLGVYGVQKDCLLVLYDIGVVCDAFGNRVSGLEEVEALVGLGDERYLIGYLGYHWIILCVFFSVQRY